MKIVNSHNEWDELQEVIVGDGFPDTIPALDFSFKLFFHDNIFGKVFDIKQYIQKRHVDEHREDIEKYVDLLKSFDIIVQRPKVPKKINKIKTPNWESTDYPALNVRDLCMIVNDTIIETPPSCRWRIFENDYMKHLFLNYFKNGAKWVSAPRPLILDTSFDMSVYDGAYNEYEIKDDYMGLGTEIMFDAANCVRMGKHILMNVSNENQMLGAKWLQNTLGNKYKILTSNLTDSHIDSTFLPLKPGLGLVKNQGINLASPRIELNVFSVNKELIICHPQYENILNKELKKYNIQAIGSPFRHCELFSGAHHCTTLDIRRKSKYEDYF